MILLLLAAAVLFMLGLFTIKLLWWAALVFIALWLVGRTRSRRKIFH